MKNKSLAFIIVTILAVSLAAGCRVTYSFTGTSIQEDVNTVTIDYFEYKALRVNPSLANDMTEAMRDKFKKLTRLEEVEENGDLEIYCEITGYDTKPMAVTSDEVAAQNRLTVTVKVNFTNRKHSEDDFENKSFSAYADYDSEQSLDAVESALCEEIIEKLIEDIFNGCVANW
ncbi:MAG: LPS assembly lipoprotein LptE [Bacteroidales bacterium]|nr:LPS assembly lipoprotein LptE [Bacteroidales bacterium]